MPQGIRAAFQNRFGEPRSLWVLFAYLVAATLIRSALGSAGFLPPAWLPYVDRLLTVALTVVTWKVSYRQPINRFGFVATGAPKAILVGFLAGTVGIAVVVGILALTGSIWVTQVNPGALTFGVIGSGCLYWLLVALAEEAQFRGLAMGALKSTRSRVVVLAGSTLWFTLAHVSNQGFNLGVAVGVALGGVFFAYLFWKSGTLLIGIAFHFAWDFFEAVIFGLGHPGVLAVDSRANDPLIGSVTFGVEGGLVSIGFFLVAIALVHFFVRNNTEYGFVMPSGTWRRPGAVQA